MPKSGDTGRSLARTAVLSSFALMSAAILLLAVTGLTGVYRTVQEIAAQQVTSECTGLANSLRTRMRAASDVLDVIASGMSSANEGLNSRQWAAGFEHFDRLVLMAPSGQPISTYPLAAMSEPVPSEVVVAASPTTRFVHTGADAVAARIEVWAVKRLAGPGGGMVAGRVRTGFIDEAVDRGGVAGWLVCVTCEHGPIAITDGAKAVPLRYAPDVGAAEAGDVTVVGSGGLQGRFLQISDVPGLTWRVAVLEPRSRIITYARHALTPAAIAATLVSALAILGAAVGSRILVAPLRELERRAQRAASGAYVRPIEFERRDEVGRLADAFNDLTTRLNSLHDVSRLLASASRTDQVLDSILVAVAHIAPASAAAVLLTDTVTGELVAERVSGASPVAVNARISTEEHFALRQALLANGPVSLPRRGVFGAQDRGQCVALPLVVRDEAFGLLLLWDAERPLSDAEMETLGTFGSQASIALRNARLFETEYASRVEAEALREVAEHLANPRDLDLALSSVGELAGRLMGADRVVLGVWERDAFGLPESEEPERQGALLQVMASAGASASGGTLVIEDVGKRPLAEAYRPLGVQSLIIVPLSVGDDPVGCLGFEYARGGVWFGEAHLGIANTIGKQLSLALANTYLFAQEQRKAANIETIFRISQAVGSSLETKVVLDRVLEVVQKIFSADAVSLMTYDTTKRLLVTPMARGMISQEILDLEVEPGEDVPGDVFEHRRPRMLGRLDPTAQGVEAYAASRGLRSLVAVPLLARGRSIGVLNMFSRDPHAYREEDVELLSTFATQAALAIDTATLYGREHAVASVLQSSIVPDVLPQIPGIDADSVYRPAGREAEIGGDYYDLFQIADGRLVVAMCDVCGKGVDAATKTSRVKYSVRALAASGSSPGRIVSEVNRIVSDTGDSSDIVTLIVGILDRRTGKLTYANGGHPPAMLLPPSKREPLRLCATGPLLGALATAHFGESVVEAPVGSLMLLYTDGVTEARRGNRFFGETRVRRALAGGGSAADVTRRVLSCLRRFAPGDLRDDVAILAIRIESEDGRPGARL